MVTFGLRVSDPMNQIISEVYVGERPKFITSATGSADNGENLRHLIGYDVLKKVLKRAVKGLTPNQVADWLDDPDGWWGDQSLRNKQLGATYNSWPGTTPYVQRSVQGVQAALDAWLKVANSNINNLTSGPKGPNSARGGDVHHAKTSLRQNYWYWSCLTDDLRSIYCIEKDNTNLHMQPFLASYILINFSTKPTSPKAKRQPFRPYGVFETWDLQELKQQEKKLLPRTSRSEPKLIWLFEAPVGHKLCLEKNHEDEPSQLRTETMSAIAILDNYVFRVSRDFEPIAAVLKEGLNTLSKKHEASTFANLRSVSSYSRQFRDLQTRFLHAELDIPEAHEEELDDFGADNAGWLLSQLDKFQKKHSFKMPRFDPVSAHYMGSQPIDLLEAAYGNGEHKYAYNRATAEQYKTEYKELHNNKFSPNYSDIGKLNSRTTTVIERSHERSGQILTPDRLHVTRRRRVGASGIFEGNEDKGKKDD